METLTLPTNFIVPRFMTSSIANLSVALAKFQGIVPAIPKNKQVEVVTSKGRYKFWYADLPTILTTIQKPLSDCELSLSQPIDEIGDKEYCFTILLHSSGEWIMSKKRIDRTERIQEFGSNLSYVRRYQVCSLLSISADDDEDGNIADDNGYVMKDSKSYECVTPPLPNGTISDKQKNLLSDLLNQLKEPTYIEVICKKHKLESIYDISRDKFNELLEFLKSKIQEKKNAAA